MLLNPTRLDVTQINSPRFTGGILLSTNGLICTKRVKSKRTSKANKPVLGHTNAAMCIVELLQMKVEQVQYAAIVAFQMRIA
uniref:Uncharacterized protein n=1 Tax=Onchocerca volvulus TaxID=6282 RepID=A0A8R1TZ53_ONCVO